MAEIKSTLDLVLERTKNLTISDEERKTLKQHETAGKIKGLVQRYLDGVSTLSEALRDLQHEAAETPEGKDILAAECLGRLDPAGDHTKIEKLLNPLFPDRTEALRKAVERWKEALAESERDYVGRARKRWEEEEISGAALVPNLERDPAWKSYCSERVAQFRKEAAAILQGNKGA